MAAEGTERVGSSRSGAAELWRLGAATLIGAFSLLASVLSTPDVPAWRWVLDGVVGLLAVGLLRWRTTRPVLVAVLVVLASTWCTSVLGAVLLAVVSLAGRRHWRSIVAVGALLVASTVVDDLIDGATDRWWRQGIGAALLCLAMVGVGAYLGSRRDLLAALRDRAESAEREQRSRVAAARVAERTRIAREMHDVLAHRISLVSMHAGLLAFRADLPEPERIAAAGVVRDNANLALVELRQVLGVLRQDGDPVPEPPQPTLTGLDDLVRDAATPGTTIEALVDADLAALPVDLGRTGYRIVQEGLTNARKHAPGASVRVAVHGSPGGLLTVEVTNRAPTAPATEVPGSGTGLIGAAERVRLAGGRLDHGPDGAGGYCLRAVLPWEANDD